MGCLANIEKYSQVLSNNTFDFFIETGTGLGVSMDFASSFSFKGFFSVEIVEELYLKCKERFKHNWRVHLSCGESSKFLDDLLPKIHKDERILFWLDAHWPGADFQINHKEQNNPEIALPLERELESIHKWRAGVDTIIIDDVRVYEMNPVPGLVFPKEKGISFVSSLFYKSHNIRKFFQDEEYLVLTPKGE